MPGLEGTRFGPYYLERLLGLGGMSEVYLAYDEKRAREVALKVIGGNQPEYLERFRREAEVVDKLHHPHILPAYDYDDCEPWHYLVMAYAPGGTLRERLLAGPLAPEETGMILQQIAEALQHAHDHGVLHRDIKPSNILFRDPTHVYLADFGLAKILDDGLEITRTGTLMGTPEYMAPDLADGPATALVDVYALGVVLYQMLTGQVPFNGNNSVEIYWKHLRELPARPSQHNPALTPGIERVILRALAKDSRRRYQSPLALADAYQRALRPLETALEEAQVEEMNMPERPEALAMVKPVSGKQASRTPSPESARGGRKGRRHFVRVTDYALAQASRLRRISSSERAVQLALAREVRLHERHTPPLQPARRSRLTLPSLLTRRRRVHEPEPIQLPIQEPHEKSDDENKGIVENARRHNAHPQLSHRQHIRRLMFGIIGFGLLFIVVLPMIILWYLSITH